MSFRANTKLGRHYRRHHSSNTGLPAAGPSSEQPSTDQSIEMPLLDAQQAGSPRAELGDIASELSIEPSAEEISDFEIDTEDSADETDTPPLPIRELYREHGALEPATELDYLDVEDPAFSDEPAEEE